MAKKTLLGIITEAVGLYFSNFDKFIKYMSFPVLGQIGGLIIVLLLTFFYTQNLPILIEKYPSLNDFTTLIAISILITLPGIAIFIKAFWEYLVAYGAINSMLDNMLKSGKVYDFNAHTELVKRRVFTFCGIWLLYGFFSIVAFCPLFWVICGILTIYFVLVFQIFTFEPELSSLGCIKRSMELVKGHFASTFFLFLVMGLITYIFIPQIVTKIFELLGIVKFLGNALIPLINSISLPDLSFIGIQKFSTKSISNFCLQIVFAQITIQYTLPLRSILWSMWYKELSKNNLKDCAPSSHKAKRPSEKLMQASHKKYGTKRINKNILKRATEKKEED